MAAHRATHVVVSATPVGYDPQYPRVEILMGSGRKWTFLLGRLVPKPGWAHPVRSVHLKHAPYEPRNQATLVFASEYKVAKAAAAKEFRRSGEWSSATETKIDDALAARVKALVGGGRKS
jgi:hypothetical protein